MILLVLFKEIKVYLEKLLKVPLKVENIDIHALVDTRAEVIVTMDSLFRELPCTSYEEISIASEGRQIESKEMIHLDMEFINSLGYLSNTHSLGTCC